MLQTIKITLITAMSANEKMIIEDEPLLWYARNPR